MEFSSWALLSLELFSTSQHYMLKKKKKKVLEERSPSNLGISIIPRNYSVDVFKEKAAESLSWRGEEDSGRGTGWQ